MSSAEERSLRILVVDDHALFRRGLVEILREQPDFQVIAQANNGPQAVQISLEERPDVILMDVQMPEGGGVPAVREIKRNSEARILMLTVSRRDADLISALQAGADGYLLKNVLPQELCQAVRNVAAGQGALSPEVTASVMRAAADAQSIAPQVTLSDREREVLSHLAQGASNAEIAAELVVSTSTIKTHVSHILKKLKASNRAEAVARGLTMGLVRQANSPLENGP